MWEGIKEMEPGTLEKKRRLLVEAEKHAMRSSSNVQVSELKLEITDLGDKENRMWF